jgi:hypothetical protein
MYSTHSKIRAKKLTIGGSPRMIIPGRGVAQADPRRNAKAWVWFRIRIAALSETPRRGSMGLQAHTNTFVPLTRRGKNHPVSDGR